MSPQLTSVEGGKSKVFTAAFREADGTPSAGAAVTFSNDACGTFSNGLFVMTVPAGADGIASVTFTAFAGSTVTCTVTAAAGAIASFNVITYRPDLTAVVVRTIPEIPRAGERFVAEVSLMLGVRTLYDVDLVVRVAPGSTAATIIPASGAGNTWPTGTAAFSVTPERAGDVTLEVTIGTRVQLVAIRFDAATLELQDMWWAQPQENGWGIAILQHRDTIVAVVFTYDASGKPTWFTMPGGTWDAERRAYSGSLYRPRGSPFYAYDAARFVPGAAVGTAKFTFTGASGAVFEGTVDGAAFNRTLTRMQFGANANPAFPGLTDLWWGGLAQNGWGISVIQQFNTFFSVWYTYDAEGVARWYVMPGGAWTGEQTYEGRIFRTTGTPFLQRPYDPALFQTVDVGPYRLRFLGQTATFDYTVEGRSGTLTLSRQPF